jgi:hypothetical protein
LAKNVTKEYSAAKNIGQAVKEIQPLRQGFHPKISELEGKVSDWLGKEARVIRNNAGDPVFLSRDETRRLRFDFNNSHGDKPHIHIEKKVNFKWKDASSHHRIYPKVE